MGRLRALEEDYALFALGPPPHDCILELAGVCPICDSYMDMHEQIGEMIREAKSFLPGYYESQTKQRTACLCKDMIRPLSTPLDDRIMAMALIINGQR